jgi:hypothetical protein
LLRLLRVDPAAAVLIAREGHVLETTQAVLFALSGALPRR